MKKVAAVLLVFVFALTSLAACARGGVADAAASPAPSSAPAQQPISPEEAIAAAATAAFMPNYRTPALMARPGRHWPPQGDEGKRGQPMRAAARTPCPDHEGEVMPCRACAAETKPAPDGWRDMYRAARDEAKNRTDDEGEDDAWSA